VARAGWRAATACASSDGGSNACGKRWAAAADGLGGLEGGVHAAPACEKRRPMARAGRRAAAMQAGSGLLCVVRATDMVYDFG
jgi:hypothetical protein